MEVNIYFLNLCQYSNIIYIFPWCYPIVIWN
jgi:hypothetical protein